ncbi:N-acetylglucosamine-6-phosphate deacetylase [Rivularia sp. UHCC 0363]|uniref:N-acetylglucosamine-6-phosphate deacetylase n=1 Tax=Rivularia sp. UHCC 0363 TaxID=3110244 RepID=UPI002B2128E5|nr:N-acetylglucosamine-6-phosphate deacetylase [Rivularia sp. UHCC 0363]MEA5596611.1 N-acetylglucosamine-6-phosphate deacetylase [Rivularia sp. UHCC 0363]
MTQKTLSNFATPLNIINALVPGYEDRQMVFINRDGIVEQIVSMDKIIKRVPLTNLQVLDAEGDRLSLGGVDLQINGALGTAFPDLNPENAGDLQKICDYLWDSGVDAFLPTLVTTSVENIERSLTVVSNFMQDQTSGAKVLGVHLEGPFLNPQKRGAHPQEFLLNLSLAEVKRVLSNFTQIIKVITLAPELDANNEVIYYLHQQGITVSLGHSQATAEQAQSAFNAGATMVTHAFNAMPPLHHREPGLLAAAITHENVMCGFIADGKHVSPMMIDLLLRASDYTKGLFLVSDALAPLGLPDGTYPWDSREITVSDGTARLADGTLSGTTLPLLCGVENLVKWGICNVETAIAIATSAPRQAIGLPGIEGAHASNLLRWNYDESNKQLTWQRLLS